MTSAVLHVLPYDLARGAQVYARALCDALDRPDRPHRIATLFAAEPGALRPDHALDTPMGPLRRAGFDPRAWIRLRRLVRELAPSVVVAHGGEPLKYCVRAVGSTPLVALRIGVSPVSSGLRARLIARQLARADLVAGVSLEVLEESKRVFGVRPERCVFIPNGRDPEVYRPRERAETLRPTVLFVGHITRTKRPEWFVAMVEALRARGFDFDARLVGDGPLLEGLRARAEAAGVEVLGRRSDVPDLLARSDVFVFTSMPEGEGMPGVFIEAGLCGVPTVATDVPGATTVIADGTTGFVVPHDDPTALEDRVARLLVDRELRERLGRAARERCREQFALATTFALWSQTLERASSV